MEKQNSKLYHCSEWSKNFILISFGEKSFKALSLHWMKQEFCFNIIWEINNSRPYYSPSILNQTWQMGPLLKPGYSTVLLSYCKSRSMSLCACKWNKQKSLLRQKYLTKCFLVMLWCCFTEKWGIIKNIGHWPIPILLSFIIQP